MKNSQKTFVLVHGAWHGAWSHDKIVKKLEASGAEVISFDLPGHGKDKTGISDISLEAYVQKLKMKFRNWTSLLSWWHTVSPDLSCRR